VEIVNAYVVNLQSAALCFETHVLDHYTACFCNHYSQERFRIKFNVSMLPISISRRAAASASADELAAASEEKMS
jgi:hypothetical protein